MNLFNPIYGRVIAYYRVSTSEQDLERQRVAIQKAGYNPTDVYEEKVSGKTLERPELTKLMDFLRPGDLVVVESFSRISRNTREFLQILELFTKKQVEFKSICENFDFSSAAGQFLLTLLAGLIQFEMELISERRREGIELAKKNGKYAGRAKIKRPSNFEENYNRWLQSTRFNPFTLKSFGMACGLKRGTLLKFVREQKRIDKERKLLELKELKVNSDNSVNSGNPVNSVNSVNGI